jgi:hypothetical protein
MPEPLNRLDLVAEASAALALDFAELVSDLNNLIDQRVDRRLFELGLGPPPPKPRPPLVALDGGKDNT